MNGIRGQKKSEYVLSVSQPIGIERKKHYNIRENNGGWKGGKTRDNRGRCLTLNKNHPRATHEGYVFDHILICEKVLGRFLKKETPIHHVDCNPSNNQNTNLVLCDSHSYHGLLHRRLRALIACGHKNWEKCRECKKYDDPETMTVHTNKKYRTIYIHKECNIKRQNKWRETHPGYFRKFYRKDGD